MTVIQRIALDEKDPVKINSAINQLAEYLDRQSPRTVLAADTTFYVRADGSDANTGTANTAVSGWLTFQHAMDVLAGSYDFNAKNVTVQIGNGTYTAGVNVNPWVGGGTLTFLGDNTTPTNVVISVASGGIPTGSCFMVQNGALPGALNIKGFQIKTSGTGTFGIYAAQACNITPGNLDFGPCVTSHIFMASGGYYNYTNTYSISGGADRHIHSNAGGIIFATGNVAGTVTISAAVAITTFAFAQEGGVIQPATATNYVNPGNVTGTKYSVTSNAVINSAGITFPGTIAGATATGGQYI